MQTYRIDFRRHIASLDGLRGLAICLVFLYHYYPRQRLNPISLVASIGWVGVDIFFVLSGFLITGILFDTLEKPNSLRKFFARRSLRLFPIYTIMVLAVVLLARPLQMPLSWKDVLFFAYGANFSTAFHIVPTFGPYLRFRHLWSLAVEEQFYLLWAPLVFLLGRRSRIMTACITGILMAILLRGVGVFHLPLHTIYQNLFTRMDSILCGALLALGLRGSSGDAWLTKPRLHVAFAAGIVIAGITLVLSHSLFNERLPTMIVGYVGNDLWCTALLALTLLPGTAVNRLTNANALRFIGRYSYGLYLWHEIPGQVFSRLMLRGEALFHPRWLSGSLSVLVLFAFCLMLAMISYHAIELPFLHLKRYFSYDHPAAARKILAEDDSIDLRPAEPSL